MAVRKPLKVSGSNLKEMTTSEINAIKTAMYWQYISNPSVTLSVVTSGGSLGTINDTRLIAGAYSTSATAFPAETTTQEPQVFNVGYSRVNETVASVSLTANTNNILYPVYYTGDGDLQSMTLQDMYDTFAYDVIDTLITADDIYSISSSTTKSGYTRVSTTPIFSDSGTDTAPYGTSIPQTTDYVLADPLAEFYLFKRNATSTSFTPPAQITASGSVQAYSSAGFSAITSNIIRYVAANVTSYRIRYSWDGSGNNSGTVTDQRLNGSGNYITQFIGADDYRAQELPNGSHVLANTYVLRVGKQ